MIKKRIFKNLKHIILLVFLSLMCFSLSLNIHGEDEKIDSYTVSIPSGVSLSKDNTSNTLNISGNLDSYNTLSINISSSNGYKLKHKTIVSDKWNSKK